MDGAGASRRDLAGFTLVEVLVVVSIVVIMLVVLLPLITSAKEATRRASCGANLRQIQHAFMLYAANNMQKFPDPSSMNLQWEDMLRPYIARPVFACPSDPELFVTVGSSYDWRDTPNPLTSLAGRTFTSIQKTDVVLAFESLPGWHSPCKMNVVRVDGSVAFLNQETAMSDLDRSVSNP